MSDVMCFVKGLKRQMASNTHVAMLCKIIKFDPQTMKADIQPVQKGLPMIVDVPVALQKAGPFFIRVPYESGDTVVVVFSDFALDGSSTAEHRIDDAIVVGGIAPGTKMLPGSHSSDLIIAKEGLGTKVVLTAGGDIIVQGGNVYLGSGSASEGVPLGDALKTWLDGHTHPSPAGETGAPSSSSPTPSQVVKAT